MQLSVLTVGSAYLYSQRANDLQRDRCRMSEFKAGIGFTGKLGALFLSRSLKVAEVGEECNVDWLSCDLGV